MTTSAHSPVWGMELGDDGTLDTVVYCTACRQEYRYNFDGTEDESYDDFVLWAVGDASDQHENEVAS